MEPTYKERQEQLKRNFEMADHMKNNMEELTIMKNIAFEKGTISYDISLSNGELIITPTVVLGQFKVNREILKRVTNLDWYLEMEVRRLLSHGLGDKNEK